MSRRKHPKTSMGVEEPAEPHPNPEADEGALWSEEVPAQNEAPAVEPGPVAQAVADVSATVEAAPVGTAEASEEIGRLQGQAAEYLDGWQRSRAEFANYKKRIEREQEESRARVVGDIMQDFVSILDDLERALQDRPTEGEAASWASGIDMIQRKLMAILDAEGVRPIIPAEAEAFDPNIHEAISHEASPDHTAGEIIGVIHQGYRIGERVIRPALVRVAK